MANFYIWAKSSKQPSACTYYRIKVPMEQIYKRGLSEVYIDDGGNAADESFGSLMYSDLSHWWGATGQNTLDSLRRIRNTPIGQRDGQTIYPPALIYDIDDHEDFIHPFNVRAFATKGVRDYPDGRLLQPGEGLVFTDANGKTIGGWQDGITKGDGLTFDIARNLQAMKIRHEIIRTCHGVTVASEHLASYFRNVIKAKDVYVFPNTIVPEDFETIRAVRPDPDKVRILWQGGLTHYLDWYPLREAVKAISAKYPQVVWVIFGEWFNWIHDAIPDEQVEHHPWKPYESYKLMRGLLNADINLCPLADDVFNRGKSAIKWYEASIWERPEATLAARVAPYKEITENETGLLYSTPEEFVEKLSALIENADLRRRLGEGARKWVLANRTPDATIPGLFDFYTHVRAKQRRDLGVPVIQPATIEQIKKVAVPMR